MDGSLTSDSLPSCMSHSDKDSDDEMKKVNSMHKDLSMARSGGGGPPSPAWRRARVTPACPLSRASATAEPCPSSPSAPAIRAAPGLEDVVPQYDRCLLLQVRLQLLSLQEGGKGPLSISTQGREQLRNREPVAKAETEAEAQPAAAPAEEVNENAEKTTVMLRNLPNQCTRASLAKFLATTDFAGQFDLVYVPMDRTSGNNLGYSFINFMAATSCQHFIKAMNGAKATKCFPGSRSGKVLQCSYAKVREEQSGITITIMIMIMIIVIMCIYESRSRAPSPTAWASRMPPASSAPWATRRPAVGVLPRASHRGTANLPTKILDVRGFYSSRISI